ncbi:MAG: UDP-3-O-(3-hydroxymyristoyl)glucosamine N-acyltransferase [Candidatus Scalindua rubra]|uniref:UDP-3-O-acylglucosamine N-acyltransferase n=1 Tax=Candidatus Scalindua brodae TaxID=237368 RepID=A0A0B0EI27_9BACT|nr:MAG: UDP-3-O-[3-hydroxymyristoyl] glucosamine N-acyltransferase [Candidatus Scalindua brodae]MBZ0109575.1 UDP-3-O-(3-hydroxymyristoyl)glucosamine N-acyltransferase [Candidatus Scalindua rubra]TWU28859.1 UDP-3-O-acylglucosamine N-acyltransferase [Candidatus Brocadiaceae bacterium S225]
MEKTLKELADYLGGEVIGDENVKIKGVMTIDEAKEGYITFVSNIKYLKKIEETAASAILVSPGIVAKGKNLLVTKNPYLAFAKVVDLMMNPKKAYPGTLDGSASVSDSAEIGSNVTAYPFVFIGENVKVADNVVLYPGVYVGDDCQIGKDTVIHPNTVLHKGTIIGERVVIHSNTVIGCSGYGYAPDGKTYYKIPQVGITVIEDDVDIGANTTINRGVLGETRIKRGTKIDSEVMIAHNVEIGEDTLITSQVGIAGSVEIGNNVILAGGAGVAGHIKVGDNVKVGGWSGVIKDLPSGGTFLGTPAIEIERMRKCFVIIQKLPEMKDTIKDLQKKIKQLEERSERWKD